jgi:DNA-directed RNA polymerase specialized sigma24 family protein
LTNNEYIELLHKKEPELIKICKYHGIYNSFNIDDMIQELYIKLLFFKDINRYVNSDNEPNMYIIFIILKNIILDFRKKENKYNANTLPNWDEDSDILQKTEEIIENEKYEFIVNEIQNIPYWFDRQIITLYVNDHHSIRSLAKETKIGANTIQPVVHRFRLQCQEKYNQKSK